MISGKSLNTELNKTTILCNGMFYTLFATSKANHIFNRHMHPVGLASVQTVLFHLRKKLTKYKTCTKLDRFHYFTFLACVEIKTKCLPSRWRGLGNKYQDYFSQASAKRIPALLLLPDRPASPHLTKVKQKDIQCTLSQKRFMLTLCLINVHTVRYPPMGHFKMCIAFRMLIQQQKCK